VVQPRAAARSTDFAIDPAIETWTPTFTIVAACSLRTWSCS
jgi:hypothetical protein